MPLSCVVLCALLSCFVLCCLVLPQSHLVVSLACPVLCYDVLSWLGLACVALSCRVLLCALYCIVLRWLGLCCAILTCLVLSCLVSSRLVSSMFVLSGVIVLQSSPRDVILPCPVQPLLLRWLVHVPFRHGHGVFFSLVDCGCASGERRGCQRSPRIRVSSRQTCWRRSNATARGSPAQPSWRGETVAASGCGP